MDQLNIKRSLDDKGFSRSMNLSALYGTLVVLVGIVAPMTEALRGGWLTHHAIAAFVTYLYAAASLFIIYSLAHETILKRQHEQQQAEEQEASATIVTSSPRVTAPNGGSLGFINLAIIEDDEKHENNVDITTRTSDGDDISACSIDTCSSSTNNIQDKDNDYDAAKIVSFRSEPEVPPSPLTPNGWSPRRRFNSGVSVSQDQAPDDVYNYIAMHMGTATLVDEGTSYFVKGGALIFALANIVYVALRIEGEHMIIRECGHEIIVYPHYVHMIFIVLQTYFLFKECRFVLRRHKPLVRFGLAHLIATNLCVWLRFLMMEVVESLDHSAETGSHSLNVQVDNTSDENVTSCDVKPMSSVAGHYLFPFVLEYSLVAMSICAFLFSSINIRVSRELYKAVCKTLSQRKRTPQGRDANDDSNATSGSLSEHQGHFAKSHTGLYLGVLIMAGAVIAMIMFFHYDGDDQKKAHLIYTISEALLLLVLLAMTIAGMVRFAKFAYDVNHSNGFDHALLLLSVAFYVVLELFEMFADVWYVMEGNKSPEDVMHLLTCILAIIQCTSQALFVLDGMQRVAVQEHQKRNKYGRGIITSLIIANVATWVFMSFLEKQADTMAPHLFYGDVAWVIIESVALPLVLFYRFHSSICLAHMWHHCYESHDDTVMDDQLLI